MSDRITPRVDTLTGVVIVGALPAGATLAWTAVGQSDDHGTVTAPGVADTTQPTALAFQIVDGIQSANYVIRGGKQTAPGNAGNIKLEVVDKNKACKVKVQSAGFSVAAIPVGVQMSKAQAPYGPGVKVKAPPLADGSNYEIRFGQRYVITVISDSGVNADLDKVEVLEVVGAFVPKSLPAPPGQPAQNDNTSFFGPFPPMLDSQVLGIIATTPGLGDDIAVTFATKADNATQAGNSGRTLFLRRVTGSLGGTASFDQYFTFKDLSTASGTLVVPKSGFTHSLKVPDPGALPPGGGGYTKATLEVKKSPSAATIAGVTVTAGSAVNGADGVVTIEVTAP